MREESREEEKRESISKINGRRETVVKRKRM